jgi:hypothetical protein
VKFARLGWAIRLRRECVQSARIGHLMQGAPAPAIPSNALVDQETMVGFLRKVSDGASPNLFR